MKPPIIVDEHGGVEIYKTIEEAAMDLEAVDVENNEYVAYDSEGRLLRLIPTSVHAVTIESAEQEPSHTDELHAVLFKFLMDNGERASWLKEASLQELVTKALEYKIDITFHSPFESIGRFFRRLFGKE
jgi:hypothetical protein